MAASLESWLARLDEPGLARLLVRRPDAYHPPRPRDLGELADRLSHPASVVAAVETFPLPVLQVLQAILALGGSPTLRSVTDLLDDGHAAEAGHPGAVAEAVAELVDRGLCWPSGDDRVHSLPVLIGMAADDDGLGLGRPLEPLLAEMTADRLRAALRALGSRVKGAKAVLADALLDLLSNAERVREVVDDAPPGFRQALLELAWGEAEEAVYDPARFRVRRSAAQWAAERGLVFAVGWGGYQWEMPTEVRLALRGEAFRLPFDPVPPPAASVPVTVDAVQRESAAAATAFAELATGLLDRLSRAPAPALKSGGLGVRELAKLAKAAGVEEQSARLALELADALGLVDAATVVTTSPGFRDWRALSPGQRLADLLRAWWWSGKTPSQALGDTGAVEPALRGQGQCPGCRMARHEGMRVLAGLGREAATQVEGFGRRLLWLCPSAHASPSDGRLPLSTVWREAHLLGVAALGALTPLGAALLADADTRGAASVGPDAVPAADPVVGDAGDGLVAAAAAVLPAAADRATFGADLTAVAVGAPSARVSAVLDFCADREGRGGATVWRLSPGSVRRALDEGGSADGLLADLRSVATGELPQPLDYLVRDVARRHGQLRVSPAVSLVRSEDTALLAEVSVDRRLKVLGLRLLAPTVLSAQLPVAEVLTAIRGAGYFPMPEEADLVDAAGPSSAAREAAGGGSRRPPSGRRGRDEPPSGADAATDPDELPDELLDELLDDGMLSFAAQLRTVTGRDLQPPEPPVSAEVLAAELVGRPRQLRMPSLSSVEGELAAQTRVLSATEVRLLAHAIETGGAVVIQYVSSSGGMTIREISGITLLDNALYAWCGLRNDDRSFLVSRIQSVAPAT